MDFFTIKDYLILSDTDDCIRITLQNSVVEQRGMPHWYTVSGDLSVLVAIVNHDDITIIYYTGDGTVFHLVIVFYV